MEPETAAAVTAALGAGDCERIRDAFLAQPANAVSSLAYVAVGAWLVARARSPGCQRPRDTATLGSAVVAVGAGSFLFHGPQPPGALWAHDVAIVAVLAAIVATDLAVLRDDPARTGRNCAAALAAAGVVIAALPSAAVPLSVAAGAAAFAAEVATHRRGLRSRRPRLGGLAAAALAVGGAANLLGRTGGVLCQPASLLQGHALWHVATAVALGGWAAAALPLAPRSRSPRRGAPTC